MTGLTVIAEIQRQAEPFETALKELDAKADLLVRVLAVLRKYLNTPESRDLAADIESFLACGRERYKPTEEDEERMTQ